jgi:hypothetical protein
MPDKKFDLGDYVEVKDRLRVLFELFAQARVTTAYELTREPDEKPKVIARALVYRTPDDPIPATGTSWMYLPGATTYTRGSEIENAETSAVGRAIGMLGILIDRSIASANEVESKREPTTEAGRADAANIERLRARSEDPYPAGDWYAEGTAEAGKGAPYDGELRSTPDGGAFGFRVVTAEKKSYAVLAEGPLALPVSLVWDSLVGQSVRVSGATELVPWSKKINGSEKRMPPYRLIRASRIEGPEVIIPATDAELQAAVDADDRAQNELFHGLTPDTEAELDVIASNLP